MLLAFGGVLSQNLTLNRPRPDLLGVFSKENFRKNTPNEYFKPSDIIIQHKVIKIKGLGGDFLFRE